MSKFYTLLCAIIGTDTTFSVTLNETESVASLKEQIKAENEHTLAAFEPDTLTLYKVNIDISTAEISNKVLEAISQNSIYCVKEELRSPLSSLSKTFKESDLLETTIYILVKRPTGESINSRVCCAIAETVLCRRSSTTDLCSVFHRGE